MVSLLELVQELYCPFRMNWLIRYSSSESRHLYLFGSCWLVVHVTRLWARLCLELFMTYSSRRIRMHSSTNRPISFYVKEALRTDQVLRILFLELEFACAPFSLPWLSILLVQFTTSLIEQLYYSYISFKLHVSLLLLNN